MIKEKNHPGIAAPDGQSPDCGRGVSKMLFGNTIKNKTNVQNL